MLLVVSNRALINSSMFILYRAPFTAGRSFPNVAVNIYGPLKSCSFQVAFSHFKFAPRASKGAAKRLKWHVLGIAPVSLTVYHHGSTPKVVQCKAKGSSSQQILLRPAHRRNDLSKKDALHFNWTRVLKLMLPDLLLLAGAIVVGLQYYNGGACYCQVVAVECGGCSHYQHSHTLVTWWPY